MLSINQERQGNIRLITLKGKIDPTNATRLDEALTNSYSEGEKDVRLVLDFRETQYLCSSALGSLLAHRRKLERRQGEIGLILSAHGEVREILKLTTLDRIFPIFSSLEEARSLG